MFNYVQTNNQYWIELLVLDRSISNLLTVCKQMISSSFQTVIHKLFVFYKSYKIYLSIYLSIYLYVYIYIYIYIYTRGGDGTSATRAQHDQ